MSRDLLQQAYGAMRHDLRKTILTMLGMAWGIATVVLLLAYGNGFGNAVRAIFQAYGATAVGIYPGRTSEQAGGNKAGVQIRLTNDDVEVVRSVLPLARSVSRTADKDVTAQSGVRKFSLHVMGVDPGVRDVWNLNMGEGRFLSDQDNFSHNFVAVIGSEAKDKLFSGSDAIGENIRLNGVSFQVVGVAAARMQEGDDDDNRTIYIPYNSMDVLQDIHYVGGIWLSSQGLDHDKLDTTIRQALGLQHNFKPSDQRALMVFDAQKQLQQFNIIVIGLKVLLAFIGTLTLGIGGIGLMNIMLVSVTQRTREIGVEKALGARKRDILYQFLAEALAITAIGGLLGVILSYLISYGVGTITFYSALAKNASAADIHLIVAPQILIIASIILAIVGVASGMIPAMRAANLDPIEALRHE